MYFPFKWVPETKWQKDQGQVLMLEMNPESVLPAISYQGEWNGSKGIMRGIKNKDGFLIEDHICEEIREGHFCDVDQRIVGADEMRKQVWTIDRHISEYLNTNKNEHILGWVGNGNLLSNPHFVAFVKGQLVYLGSEIQSLSKRIYTSLVVRKPGHRRVSIEPIKHSLCNGSAHVFNAQGVDITGEIEYATFGQQIVRRGQPIDRDELKRMALGQQFYDLRHLFLFGRMPVGNKRWLDTGLDVFWDNGELNIEHLKGALDGNPLIVDVRQFDEIAVLTAMHAKGYDQVPVPMERGQFSLRNQKLTVMLLDGIYPHSMIGVRKDGIVVCVVLRGLSNRLGVTILDAAEMMASLGANDAVILDNGADVMMNFDGDQVLGSAEGERYRLRSVLLFRKEDARIKLAPNDFRLVSYPKLTSRAI